MSRRRARCVVCSSAIAASSRVSSAMRSRILRRSSSRLDSPAPLPPMPPRWRSRPLPDSRRRGTRYCRRTISTCALAVRERACRRKISRMTAVRSRHLEAGRLFEIAGLRRGDVVIDQDDRDRGWARAVGSGHLDRRRVVGVGAGVRESLVVVVGPHRHRRLLVSPLRSASPVVDVGRRSRQRLQGLQFSTPDNRSPMQGPAALGDGRRHGHSQGSRQAVHFGDRRREGGVIHVGKVHGDQYGPRRWLLLIGQRRHGLTGSKTLPMKQVFPWRIGGRLCRPEIA